MYCTKQDMIDYLSRRGVVSFSDHDETGIEDDDVVDDCRERASDEITGNIYPLYAEAELASSTLIKHWATVLACYYLCCTRGNGVPTSIQEEYEKLTAIPDGLLERTREGSFVLPGLRRSSVNVPAFSNLTVDRRYRREQVRVTTGNSSNIPSAIEQDKAPEITSEG